MKENSFVAHDLYVHRELGQHFNDITIHNGRSKDVNSICLFDDNQIAMGLSDHEREFPETQIDIKKRQWIGVYSRKSIYLYNNMLLFHPHKVISHG